VLVFPERSRTVTFTSAANLARPGGISTDVDVALDETWRGFAIQEALSNATGCDVRVVNDANLAALGVLSRIGNGNGVDVGHRLGLALTNLTARCKGSSASGHEWSSDGRTFDEVLGERARAQDDVVWARIRRSVGDRLRQEFGARNRALGGRQRQEIGGRDIRRTSDSGSSFHGNNASLQGVAKLFYG